MYTCIERDPIVLLPPASTRISSTTHRSLYFVFLFFVFALLYRAPQDDGQWRVYFACPAACEEYLANGMKREHAFKNHFVASRGCFDDLAYLRCPHDRNCRAKRESSRYSMISLVSHLERGKRGHTFDSLVRLSQANTKGVLAVRVRCRVFVWGVSRIRIIFAPPRAPAVCSTHGVGLGSYARVLKNASKYILPVHQRLFSVLLSTSRCFVFVFFLLVVVQRTRSSRKRTWSSSGIRGPTHPKGATGALVRHSRMRNPSNMYSSSHSTFRGETMGEHFIILYNPYGSQ